MQAKFKARMWIRALRCVALVAATAYLYSWSVLLSSNFRRAPPQRHDPNIVQVPIKRALLDRPDALDSLEKANSKERQGYSETFRGRKFAGELQTPKTNELEAKKTASELHYAHPQHQLTEAANTDENDGRKSSLASAACENDVHGFRPVLDRLEITSSLPGPKILCFVNTHEKYHTTRVRAVLDTWGPSCDRLVFASSKTDFLLGTVQINNTRYEYDDLWNKHRETLRYIYETYAGEYEWFFKADDDTYVILTNLKEFLDSQQIRAQHEDGVPLYVGYPWSAWVSSNAFRDKRGRALHDTELLRRYLQVPNNTKTVNAGGAGYAMNRSFLQHFMTWIDSYECGSSKAASSLLDDAMIALCASFFGVFPYNSTRDEYGLERFHQHNPSQLHRPAARILMAETLAKRSTGGFQSGVECCSTKSISFHKLTPAEMHSAHDLLFACRTNAVQTSGTYKRRLPMNVSSTALRKKTLVVLVGSIRVAEPAWNSLYEHVLDVNNADLALIAENIHLSSSSLRQRAKYVWRVDEYQDWSEAIDQIFGTKPEDEDSWRFVARASTNGPFGSTKEDPFGNGAIRGLSNFFLLQNVLAARLLDLYDRFLVSRADQYYTVDLDLDRLDASKIWIPLGEDWYGIRDRFFVCGKDHIVQALNTHYPAVMNPRKYYNFRGTIESFVKRRWEEDGILQHVRRFRSPMFTTSVDGFRAFIEDGIQVRYEYVDEYYQAMSALRNKEIVGSAKGIQRHSSMPFIIVIQATTGMVPLVKSWLSNTESMEAVHENTLLIVDESVYQELDGLRTNATILRDALPSLLQQSWPYGSQGHWRTVLHHQIILDELLHAGVSFLLARPDATWIRNVYEDNDLTSDIEHDLVLRSDDNVTKDIIGISFVKFRATDEVKKLWHAVSARFQSGLGGGFITGKEKLSMRLFPRSDISIFHEEMQQRVSLGLLKAKFLSACKYPSGPWYGNGDHRNMAGCKETFPVVIQNNGILGNEGTIRR